MKAVPTPWAPARDHHAIVLRMDALLRVLGVSEVHVRRRLTAHAIVAAGWRQAIWHYNAWGVQKGRGWEGDVYVMPTHEVEHGETVYHPDQLWRVFGGWREALADTMERVERSQGRRAALYDSSAPDGEYWTASKAAKYFTAAADPVMFESICRRYSRELADATPEELADAEAWALGEVGGAAEGAAVPFGRRAACAGLVAAIGVALLLAGLALAASRKGGR